MELAHLRTLVHVAELGSLSRAADRLDTVQGVLSRHVQALESEFGTRLFERHGRGMVLTDTGREALLHAQRILGDLETMRLSVGDVRKSLRGPVAFGMPPTVAEIVTTPLAQACLAAHPELRPRFVAAFTGHLLDWMHRGDIDMAVLYDPQRTRSLSYQPLLVEELFLVGSAQSELTMTNAVAFGALKHRPMLLPSVKHGLRQLLDRCAQSAGIELDVRVEADSLSTLESLTAAGIGYTILPFVTIQSAVEAGHLQAAPLIDPSPRRRMVLAYPNDRRIPRAPRYLGELVRTIVADLVKRKLWAGHLLAAESGTPQTSHPNISDTT